MAKLSVAEIKAVAETAITARTAADAAKAALEANPDDESLKSAYEQAEKAAIDAKAAADALSQDDGSPDAKRIEKMKRRRAILTDELRAAGALEDDDEGDDDDEEDLDKPVTRRDLLNIERQRATQSALQMAEAIQDPVAKKAVKDSLARLVPSGDSAKDFADAVAIANREKNSKVLEEIARKGLPTRHGSGAGAPPAREDTPQVPELTQDEKAYLGPPFNMTPAEIVAARGTQQ